MKKLVLLTMLLVFSLSASLIMAAPPQQDGSGERYSVQAGDWLSKLAEKYYGDPLAYPVIVEATNAKAAEDATYTVIDNPDLIEVGQALWIPAAAETGAIGMANPASVYCGEQGGTVEIRDGDDGQYGVCVFADGSECEEWAFMNGECTLGGETAMTAPAEVAVADILLAGDLTDRNAEISGMDWYGDNLILLPQYPNFAGEAGDGFVYTILKENIAAFLDGSSAEAIEPAKIPFSAPNLQESIAGFEGYEAIAFVGDNTVFVTIEAENDDGTMRGYLVKGSIEPDLSALTLDTGVLTEIAAQSDVGNMSEESLLIVGDTVATFYEANGVGVNPNPVAHLFGMDAAPAGEVPLANFEYRLTDATKLDSGNRFWGINYFFPGDDALLPQSDPIVSIYGEGVSHTTNDGVERLVEFQYTDSGISLTDSPPIQLQLLAEDLRNWEGIVRLGDRGFLLATDKYPTTILAFVPYAME